MIELFSTMAFTAGSRLGRYECSSRIVGEDEMRLVSRLKQYHSIAITRWSL